jgi:hypothetical protein
LSPNGRHLTADGTYQLVEDAAGRDVYRATAGTPAWVVPPLSTVAQDYTFYFLIRPATTNDIFLFDANIGRLVVAINLGAGALFSGSWSMSNYMNSGELVCLTYRMNSGGASIRKNKVVTSTGGYNQRQVMDYITFGRNSGGLLNAFLGDMVAWGAAPGNDSDAQVLDTENYLLSL